MNYFNRFANWLQSIVDYIKEMFRYDGGTPLERLPVAAHQSYSQVPCSNNKKRAKNKKRRNRRKYLSRNTFVVGGNVIRTRK